MRGAESSLFAHLFAPVYESQLKTLGISERDRATRQEKLELWAGFCMHEYWKESRVVAHASSSDGAKKLPHYDEYTMDDDPEKRVENDRKFLEICCAIVADEEDAVLDAFAGFHSSVDDLNYCFGTTLLGFAVSTGHTNMLQLLLRSVKSIKQEQLYKYLFIAIAELDRPKKMIGILLNHSIQHMKDTAGGNVFVRKDVARRILIKDLLISAKAKRDKRVFDEIYKWMERVPNFHGKLVIYEAFFNQSLYDENPCVYLPKLDTLSKQIDKIPGPRAAIPAYYLKKSYQRQLDKKFSDVYRDGRWMLPHRWGGYRDSNVPGYCMSGGSSIGRMKYIKLTSPLFKAVANKSLDWADRLLWAGADAGCQEDGVGLLDVAWNAKIRLEVAQLVYAHGWRYRDGEWLRCGDAQV